MITIKKEPNVNKSKCPACDIQTDNLVIIKYGPDVTSVVIRSSMGILIICASCANGLADSIKLAQMRS